MSSVVKAGLVIEAPGAQPGEDRGKTVEFKTEKADDPNVFSPERELLKNQEEQERLSLLRQAMKKAEAVTGDAAKQADQILNNAKKQARMLREEADALGYAEGYARGQSDGMDAAEQRGMASLRELVKFTEDARAALALAAEEQEKDLLLLAAEMANKVMQQHVAADEDALPRMLEEVIRENEKAVKIYISEYNKTLKFRVDKKMYAKLKALSENLRVIVLKEDDENDDIIQVETETGMIDVNINGQMKNLKAALNLDK